MDLDQSHRDQCGDRLNGGWSAAATQASSTSASIPIHQVARDVPAHAGSGDRGSCIGRGQVGRHGQSLHAWTHQRSTNHRGPPSCGNDQKRVGAGSDDEGPGGRARSGQGACRRGTHFGLLRAPRPTQRNGRTRVLPRPCWEEGPGDGQRGSAPHIFVLTGYREGPHRSRRAHRGRRHRVAPAQRSHAHHQTVHRTGVRGRRNRAGNPDHAAVDGEHRRSLQRRRS